MVKKYFQKTALEYANEFNEFVDWMLFESKQIRDNVYRILKNRGWTIRKKTLFSVFAIEHF